MIDLVNNIWGGDEPKPKKKATPAAMAADTIITPKGNIVTRQQFQLAAKNGLEFNNLKDYANYVESWAKPIPNQVSPATAKAQAVVSPQAPLIAPAKPVQDLSDKAKGLASNYYRKNF